MPALPQLSPSRLLCSSSHTAQSSVHPNYHCAAPCCSARTRARCVCSGSCLDQPMHVGNQHPQTILSITCTVKITKELLSLTWYMNPQGKTGYAEHQHQMLPYAHLGFRDQVNVLINKKSDQGLMSVLNGSLQCIAVVLKEMLQIAKIYISVAGEKKKRQLIQTAINTERSFTHVCVTIYLFPPEIKHFHLMK